MFFKRFKTLSIQKFINRKLSLRVVDFNSSKIESVGVIFDYDVFHDYSFFRKMIKDICKDENKVRFLSLIDSKSQKPTSWDAFCSMEDFGWHGNYNNGEILDFSTYDFDLLISYYKPNNIYLNFLTTITGAKLKVGISNEDQRLHDIIIDTQLHEKELFNVELKKYLTGLNKI